VYKYFDGEEKNIFSLQAINVNNNKMIRYDDTGRSTQFILIPQGKKFDGVPYENYSTLIAQRIDLTKEVDNAFATLISSAKPFTNAEVTDKANIGKIDLGIDEAWVYAYMFTHALDKHRHIMIPKSRLNGRNFTEEVNKKPRTEVRGIG
jgi:hypothetical protein